MDINYDFYKATGLFDSGKKWFVRAVANGTTETDEMMERIEKATTLNVSDLKGAIDALVSQIADALRDGRRVHIDGLGHFSISIDGDVVENEEGELRLKHAAVRTVNFRPEGSLMRQLSDAKFTSKRHLGRSSAAIDEAKLPAVLAALSEEKGFFTAAAFRKDLGLTQATGNRVINRLLDDGVLENIGTRHNRIFRQRSTE